MQKQTKIIATIGPASEDKDVLRRMAQAGMNVTRLNFSHGEHAWHAAVIGRVRELSYELNVPIGILADIQGPRIRLRVAREMSVKRGEKVLVSDVAYEEELAERKDEVIFLDQSGIAAGIEPGHLLLIEDGLLQLKAVRNEDGVIEAEVLNDGVIKNRKGVNLPDSKLSLPVLTEKDEKDLAFVVREGVDYVGLSFVGSAEDIRWVREKMRALAGEGMEIPKIVAKIERKEAVKNLDAIIEEADAIMVARGDLGIEMPESEVVLLQKEIIAKSLQGVKPVIVATQMMKSMTENPRPTRAEVSDVSNAVIDHADAVMLSEESAMGKYPVETVAMMAEIVTKTEESPFDDVYKALAMNLESDYAVMVRSVYELAMSFQAKAILLLSMSGFTARLMSHFRPQAHLLVATNDRRAWQRSALVWGVDAYLFEGNNDLDGFIDLLAQEAKKDGKLVSGDKIVACLGRHQESETLQLVGVKEVV
jgi:pyruvate kinase